MQGRLGVSIPLKDGMDDHACYHIRLYCSSPAAATSLLTQKIASASPTGALRVGALFKYNSRKNIIIAHRTDPRR